MLAEYLMWGVLGVSGLMLAGYAVEEIFRAPADPDEYGEPRE